MKAQHGFASLIMLLIYAGIAAAVLGGLYAAWTGFKSYISRPYVEAQMKADQAVVDKANKAQRDAESERDNAKSDTAACVQSSARQSSEVDRWKSQADRNAAAAREAKAQAQREAVAAAPKIADLQAKAAAAPKLESCEIELGKARAVLQDSLRARRGIPGAVK